MTMTIDGSNGFSLDGQFNSASSFGFKNRIINGAMMIDQRNSGAASANTINGYTVDRWTVLQSTTGKLIAQQNAGAITPPAGYIKYLGVTSQSAYTVLSTDLYRITQPIEGLNVSDLGWGTANAQTVTLSFWVRSSLTGTFGGAIGNVTGASTYPFNYTINSANTWEQKTLTIVGPTSGTYATDNTTGIYLQFMLAGGSSVVGGTANTWGTSAVGGPTGCVNLVATNGATFYITGVQLEKGSTATSFDYRPYGTELQLCQRYCFVDNQPIGSAFAAGGNYNASTGFCTYRFPVPMRSAPTMTYSALSDFYKEGGGRQDVPTSLTTSTSSSTATKLNILTTTSTANAGINLVAVTNSSTLTWNAEL